jgi:hypothetical protein
MNTRYVMLIAIVSLAFLSGCENRFNSYEPYSTFDDRMASPERLPTTPDDQMPPADSGSQYSSADDSSAYDNYSPSASYDQPKNSGPQSAGSSQSDLEVPYSETTKTKHAYNVGGY